LQQADDLGDNFKVSKRMNKTTTIEHISSKDHDLKGALERQFRVDEQAGRLFLKKKDVAVDYLGKQPSILTICCMPEKNSKGFLANGMLDNTKRLLPVFQTIIGTCKKSPKPHHYELIMNLFPKLMDYSYNNGMRYIDDKYLISLGFPASIDAYGNEKIKEQGIAQECQQRAKCLTGQAEVAARAKRLEEIANEKKRKQDQAKARAIQKRIEDLATVKALCEAAGKDPTQANLEHCTMEHFALCNADVLRHFIAARHPTMTNPTSTKHLKKPRGKAGLEEALAGTENLISVAYSVRMEKSRASEVELVSENQVAELTPTYMPPPIDRISIGPPMQDISPSLILNNPSTLDVLLRMMDSRDILPKTTAFHARPVTPSTAKLMDKADLLFMLLKVRLTSHIQKRVKVELRTHWSLELARRNLAVVAAYMVYVDHLLRDIQCAGELDCLLSNPSGNKFLVVSDQTRSFFGCYLHFDANKGVWIRSGSAVGEGGFGKRFRTHESRAKQDTCDDDSQFYLLYPHSDSARSNSRGREGLFEYLTPYIGAYFASDAAVSSDFSNGGVFQYTSEEKARVSALNFSGMSDNKKYMRMTAYFFELGYDLAIGRRFNVSGSPGLEGCGLRPPPPEDD